jgi:hypothetical protein
MKHLTTRKWAALLAAVTLVGLAVAVATAVAGGGDPQRKSQSTALGHVPNHQVLTGGVINFNRIVTDRAPQSTSSEVFVDLTNFGPGGGARVVIPARRSALIMAHFTAESRCSGGGDQNWCEVRILIGGAEGYPNASAFPPDTFAFDSTDSNTETFGSWEGHAMDRARCFRPSRVARVIPVQVQWKVTNFDGGGAPEFWLDDKSLTIQRAVPGLRPCAF